MGGRRTRVRLSVEGRLPAMSGHTSTAGKLPLTGHLTWRVLDARAGLRRRVTHPSAQSESPAGAGPVLTRGQLLLAPREAESSEAEAEKGEGGGFWNCRTDVILVGTGIEGELPFARFRHRAEVLPCGVRECHGIVDEYVARESVGRNECDDVGICAGPALDHEQIAQASDRLRKITVKIHV